MNNITTQITVNGMIASTSNTATMDDPCRAHAAIFVFPSDEGDVTEQVYDGLLDAWKIRESEVESVTIGVAGDEITLSIVR